MPNKSRPTFKKRQRELEQQQRRRDKLARRQERKERAAQAPPMDMEEDPDIAGIQPGPQPLPDDWNDVPGQDRPKRPSQDD
jgi:hypothetical protein